MASLRSLGSGFAPSLLPRFSTTGILVPRGVQIQDLLLDPADGHQIGRESNSICDVRELDNLFDWQILSID